MQVSVIATVYNEADTISGLLDSLYAQRRPPDEVVIADAGSTDGTLELLDQAAATHSSMRVITQRGDRSVGRNAAITAATFDIIASIDGGCVARSDWLGNLIEPMADGAEWVAGFYEPRGETALSTSIGAVMVWTEARARRLETFLPSARSMAFTRQAWAAVGGFPEGVNFAEDSLFDERLLEAGYRPTPAWDAIVEWRPPRRLRELARTQFTWSRGDGALGLRRFYAKRRFASYLGPVLAVAAGVVWWWPLTVAGAAALGALTARATSDKYRVVPGWGKWIFIPVAHLVGEYAALAGYVWGRLFGR